MKKSQNQSASIGQKGSSGRSPSAGEIRRQLERMLANELFVRSPRMARFLRHVVEAHLNGREDGFSEYVLAFEVFDRPETFNPVIEPIVRVEASRLRSKIRRYYATDGKLDAVWVGLSKRGYRPAFRYQRPVQTSPQSELPAIAFVSLVDLDRNAQHGVLCQALSDQILQELAETKELKILSRGRTKRRFTGDPLTIARSLRSDAVLQGALGRVDGEFRVRVQLTAVRSGASLWTKTFHKKDLERPAEQELIAQGIRQGLLRFLKPGERAQDRVEGGGSAIFEGRKRL